MFYPEIMFNLYELANDAVFVFMALYDILKTSLLSKEYYCFLAILKTQLYSNNHYGSFLGNFLNIWQLYIPTSAHTSIGL